MWQALLKKGYPEQTIETTLKSISESTLKQYNTSYQAWWNYCTQNNVDPFVGDVSVILLFMQDEFQNKMAKYGTLNQHRSALSLIFTGETGKDILIRRFLKGVFRLRPPKPRYNVTWDPRIVINYIDSLGSNEDLSILTLTKKLATLLALSTGHRIQTLHLIRVDNIVFNNEGAHVYIPDHIKTSRTNACQPCLKIPYFNDKPFLCVTSTLLTYIERTSEHRSEKNVHLFITARDPYRRASKATISRWIKQVLRIAGINTNMFSAHSTRHASTSAAARNGLSWDIIRNSAGWSQTSSTFTKFYNRPLEDPNSFAKSVFNM